MKRTTLRILTLSLVFAFAACASHGPPRVKCSGHLERINAAKAEIESRGPKDAAAPNQEPKP